MDVIMEEMIQILLGKLSKIFHIKKNVEYTKINLSVYFKNIFKFKFHI
jgi:hypothetical protein